VTPEVFLNVLKGNEAGNKGKGTGKVLKSTADDKVFIYFSDHGASGLIAFPSTELYADDLIKTLKYMHDKKMYKRLVFYLEACESGSMFDKILPNNWEVYATTAANPSESSWAAYCSPDDTVNGKSIGSCLGDEYSVNWLEDSGAAEKGKHLQNQFEDVRNKTVKSHVQQYGVLSWTDEPIDNYQGDISEKTIFDRFYEKFGQCVNKLHLFFMRHKASEIKNYKEYLKKAKSSVVDSRDVKLHYLMQKFTVDKSQKNENLLSEEILYRKKVDNFFSKFNEKFAISAYQSTVSRFDCLKKSVNTFKTQCKSLWGEYTLKYVKSFNTACNTTETKSITAHIKSLC